MTEKKATSKATAPKKVAVKKAAAPKKAASATPVLYINAESVGFRAGDVYQQKVRFLLLRLQKLQRLVLKKPT